MHTTNASKHVCAEDGGGAWGGLKDSGSAYGMRSAKRYAFVEWTRSFIIGFRCAKDL